MDGLGSVLQIVIAKLREFCAASVSSLALLASAGGSEKPNIIYILAHDLGYGDLSCDGQQKLATHDHDRDRDHPSLHYLIRSYQIM